MAEDLRSEIRKAICEKCNGHGCQQRPGPISQEEYEQLGAEPTDEPTVETVRKMFDISCKPECVERMLNEHPVEWWYKRMTHQI